MYAPHDAVVLKGWTVAGLANVHSHAFQRLLRGEIESGAGDFWEWRVRMYRFTEWEPADFFNPGGLVFGGLLEWGRPRVGVFHFLTGQLHTRGTTPLDTTREEER